MDTNDRTPISTARHAPICQPDVNTTDHEQRSGTPAPTGVAKKGTPSTVALKEITSRLDKLEAATGTVHGEVIRNRVGLREAVDLLGILDLRLDKLELGRHDSQLLELRAKLKETIQAVEKLAKGKSLGALGLPAEESWDPPA